MYRKDVRDSFPFDRHLLGGQAVPVVEFTTPNDFFKAKVENAASGLQVDLSTELEFYLVNLLCEFIQPQNLKIGDMNLLDTPLALIYKQALEAPPQMQVKVYKKLGDISLYVAGYFQASLSRKTVGRSYYISMGSSAYQKMSNIMKNRHREMHLLKCIAAFLKSLRLLLRSLQESVRAYLVTTKIYTLFMKNVTRTLKNLET